MAQNGEGSFKLGDVKQIRTTPDFTSLDENIRGCQTETSYEDCTTHKYIEALKQKCACLPFNLQNYSSYNEEVISLELHFLRSLYVYLD